MAAVGTALAGGPPHRSQRAELPHWAPASGSGGEAHFREGVLRRGRAVAIVSRDGSSVPSSTACAGCGAAAPGTSAGSPGTGRPTPRRSCRARRNTRMCPCTTLPSHRPCTGTGSCMRSLSWSLTSRSFARIRFEIVMRLIQNRPFLDLAQMCVKPRKSNVSGLPCPRAAPVPGGVPPELDQSRLVRVQLQPELREPARAVAQEPLAHPVYSNPTMTSSANRTMITSPCAWRCLHQSAHRSKRSAGTRSRAAVKPMPPAVIPFRSPSISRPR